MLCHNLALILSAKNGLQLDDDILPTGTNIYWEAWASQKVWKLCEKQWFYLYDSILIPCVSPRFQSCPLKDLHRYHSAPPSGVASMKNALFGVSCTYQNMFFENNSKLPTARNWIWWDLLCSLRAVSVFLLQGRAPQLCHHKCFLQKWWRGKSPNHAIVRSPAGHQKHQVPTGSSQKKMVDSQRW